MKSLKRRSRQNITDYRKRINLLKGESPRIAFRKSNKYVTAQYITSKNAQDKVEVNLNSKSLIKYGWPKEKEGSLKSIPASYLTGLMIGKKIIKEKKKTPIIDFGMIRTLHKTKVFAFLKGLIDAGIKIPCEKENFPEEERIQGKKMKEDFSKKFNEIKIKIEKE